MKIFDRIQLAALAMLEGTRAGNALGILLNRYEAAQPSSPDRSWLPAFVRDARYDANSFTRWELFRKIAYFERNIWLVGAIRDEYVKWTVGPNGMPVIPSSSDPKWNAAMLESYREWCKSPFLDSTLTMGQGHRLMAGNEQLFGEMFINFTRSKQTGRPSQPAIQFIESPRCSEPGLEYSYADGGDIVDGVQLGHDAATGKVTKPIGYHVRDGFMGEEWTFRSTADMLHVFDPKRIGMYRAITPYHASIETLHDLDDLEKMEMQRAKQNAEVANILTNQAGQISNASLRRQAWNNQQQPGTPQANDDDKRINAYRKILGSRTIALKNGETLTQFDSKTPSAATQWYWRYKIGQVAAAAKVPLILIFPELIEHMQGTVVRGIYDNAHMFFRGKSHIFATAAERIYQFYANWARYNDPRCVDAPADWAKCHVILPRAVNVDIGRNSAAMLAELAAGVTNLDDIAGASGTTAEVLIRKKARNVAMVKQIAAEESASAGVEVKPGEIMGNLADIASKLSATEQQAPADTDENPKGRETANRLAFTA